MNKQLLVSVLATLSGFSGAVAAQEVGKVISSTPVTREVAISQKQCAPDAHPRDACRSVTNYETRTIGYKVVYEYAGKQREVQLPFPPGDTIELDVTPAVPTQSAAASIEETFAPERVYVDRVDRVVERVYDQTDYYEPVYPARTYYSPGYYTSPIYPLLGVALGYSWGSRHHGHWGHRHGWSGHRHRGR